VLIHELFDCEPKHLKRLVQSERWLVKDYFSDIFRFPPNRGRLTSIELNLDRPHELEGAEFISIGIAKVRKIDTSLGTVVTNARRVLY